MLKSNFAYHCRQKNPSLYQFIEHQLPQPFIWKSILPYQKLIQTLEAIAPIPEDILAELQKQKVKFDAPAPKRMEMKQIKEIIVREMERFDKNPTTFEDESYDLEIDGYKGHIRRTFVNKPQEETTKMDVEYHIHLNNFEECRTKREMKRWGAFIYINEPDYWNNGRYKSIEGTNYGLQYSIHF
jgi:hypothetical protein